eukprot:scaffold6315_cov71-Cyclotella_meneghiniana.AAC.3
MFFFQYPRRNTSVVSGLTTGISTADDGGAASFNVGSSNLGDGREDDGDDASFNAGSANLGDGEEFNSELRVMHRQYEEIEMDDYFSTRIEMAPSTIDQMSISNNEWVLLSPSDLQEGDYRNGIEIIAMVDRHDKCPPSSIFMHLDMQYSLGIKSGGWVGVKKCKKPPLADEVVIIPFHRYDDEVIAKYLQRFFDEIYQVMTTHRFFSCRTNGEQIKHMSDGDNRLDFWVDRMIPSPYCIIGDQTIIKVRHRKEESIKYLQRGGVLDDRPDGQSVPAALSLITLPAGWQVRMSKSKGKPYYVHPNFGPTWDTPVDVDNFSDDDPSRLNGPSVRTVAVAKDSSASERSDHAVNSQVESPRTLNIKERSLSTLVCTTSPGMDASLEKLTLEDIMRQKNCGDQHLDTINDQLHNVYVPKHKWYSTSTTSLNERKRDERNESRSIQELCNVFDNIGIEEFGIQDESKNVAKNDATEVDNESVEDVLEQIATLESNILPKATHKWKDMYEKAKQRFVMKGKIEASSKEYQYVISSRFRAKISQNEIELWSLLGLNQKGTKQNIFSSIEQYEDHKMSLKKNHGVVGEEGCKFRRNIKYTLLSKKSTDIQEAFIRDSLITREEILQAQKRFEEWRIQNPGKDRKYFRDGVVIDWSKLYPKNKKQKIARFEKDNDVSLDDELESLNGDDYTGDDADNYNIESSQSDTSSNGDDSTGGDGDKYDIGDYCWIQQNKGNRMWLVELVEYLDNGDKWKMMYVDERYRWFHIPKLNECWKAIGSRVKVREEKGYVKSISNFRVSVVLDGGEITTHHINENLITVDVVGDSSEENNSDEPRDKSSYELLREENITRNKKRLHALGLGEHHSVT